MQFIENPDEGRAPEKPAIPSREELLKKIRWQHEIDNARQEKVDRVISRPTLKCPSQYKNLRELIDTGMGGSKNFDALIGCNVSLYEKLLILANGPLLSLDPRVQSVTELVSKQNVDEVADLVLGIEVIHTLKQPKSLPVELPQFWMHGITCGLAARALARFLEAPEASRFFVAGLLADLGLIALADHSPETSQEVHKEARKANQPLWVIEDRLLEFNHAQVGATLLKEWGLPVWMSQAVQYHHQPLETKRHRQGACILHISDVIAHDLRLGSSGEPVGPRLDPEAVKQLGVTRSVVQRIKEEIRPVAMDLKRILIFGNALPISGTSQMK